MFYFSRRAFRLLFFCLLYGESFRKQHRFTKLFFCRNGVCPVGESKNNVTPRGKTVLRAFIIVRKKNLCGLSLLCAQAAEP